MRYVLALLLSFGILGTAIAAEKEIIPLPANTRELKQEVRSIAGSEFYFTQHESNLNPGQIRNFYRKALSGAGWTEKNYLDALKQVPGFEVDAAALKAAEDNLNFEKDGAMLNITFAPDTSGRKTAYNIMQGKLEISGDNAEDLDFIPRLLAVPRHEPAPVYPEAALISLSEDDNFMQAAYSSKADVDTVTEFYRRGMHSYGWELVKDSPLRDVPSAASDADIAKYCPECAKKGIVLPQTAMAMKELVYTNDEGGSCRIGLFEVYVPAQGQISGMNFTNIMVDYEKK